MEFDPETNTYTSHGPSQRASDVEREVKKLKKELADLKARVYELESEVETLR